MQSTSSLEWVAWEKLSKDKRRHTKKTVQKLWTSSVGRRGSIPIHRFLGCFYTTGSVPGWQKVQSLWLTPQHLFINWKRCGIWAKFSQILTNLWEFGSSFTDFEWWFPLKVMMMRPQTGSFTSVLLPIVASQYALLEKATLVVHSFLTRFLKYSIIMDVVIMSNKENRFTFYRIP